MRPYALRDRPVVVLSNNDGCCVARSDEANALGIRMGQPFFEVRELLAQHQGRALSSTDALFAARVLLAAPLVPKDYTLARPPQPHRILCHGYYWEVPK